MEMTAMQMTPPTALSTPSNNAGGRPPLGGGGDSAADAMNAMAMATSSGPSGSSALEITYSTISPKVEQPQQPPAAAAFPMHIKLNLIDQNPRPSNLLGSNGESSSCESPYPMTPMTPMTPGGGSSSSSGGDLSKKQRHNLREQRRILRISNQFDILRHKLEGAGYSSSKKDKYSVLQATLDYISQLERNQLPGTTAGAAHGSGTPIGGCGTPMSMQRRPPHHHLPTSNGNGGRLSISAPSPTANGMMDPNGNGDASNGNKHVFLIDSMPSPVPALSMSGGMQSFPIDMDGTAMFPGPGGANADAIEGSTASYRDVFANSSMPSLLAKLDGTIVEANALFLELCCKNIDELRLHSLYTMCTAVDAPKMYNLVNRILACEVASAQSKMMWHFATTGDRKVFVSVSMIHDAMHRPANLHCSLLPLS